MVSQRSQESLLKEINSRRSHRLFTRRALKNNRRAGSQRSQPEPVVRELRVVLHRLSQHDLVNMTSGPLLAQQRHQSQQLVVDRQLQVVIPRIALQARQLRVSIPRLALQDRQLRVSIPRLALQDRQLRVSIPRLALQDRQLKVVIPRLILGAPVSAPRQIPGVELNVAVQQLAHDDAELVDAAVVDVAAPVEVVRPQRRVWGDNIARRRTWKTAVNTPYGELEQICRAPFSLGELSERCIACDAKFFRSEFPVNQGTRRICCKNGAIVLPRLTDTPHQLMELFTGNGRQCNQFRDKIRYINGLLAMASFKTHIPGGDRAQNLGRCFAVTGKIYHYFNGVPNTQDLDRPRLNHYYFLDVADAMAHRQAFIADAGVDVELLGSIENILRRVNPYMRAYMTMGEQLAEERARRPQEQPLDNVYIGFLDNMNRARRNYNLPESRCDIAALFVGTEPPFEVDLILYPRDEANVGERRSHVLSNLNRLADPMVYPLLFPGGDDGRSLEIKTITDGTTVSCRQYYRYRLQIREGFSNLHYGQKLFQQYVVDAWCKAEGDTIYYLKHNQHKFRLAAEAAVARFNRRRAAHAAAGGAAVNNDDDRVGRPFILPVSFEGSERNLKRKYTEAMAVIARHGKPDLLITFTCNPNWPEISVNLPHHQRWEHRPDLVCRVFSAKLKEFMNDIVQKQLYGVVLNYHYVIEFQKRGLPHAHIVVTFVLDDKIHNEDDVDGIVCAYIPDEQVEPEMYERVARHQVHSMCLIRGNAATCMVDGKCRFNFPQAFAERTIINRGSNQRPVYRRPRDGRTVQLMNQAQVIDNRRIVPYNAYALAKYNCHLNFEVVGSIKTLKYLHKYLTKGDDSIRVDVNAEGNNELDEIQRYLNCRYVSSIEAAWRLFEFKMHDRSHAVMFLPVHLPGFRDIVFDEHDDVEQIQAALNKPSKLEAFFRLNATDPNAHDLLYVQIPEYYTWQARTGTWVPRQVISKMIGTVYEVGPNDHQIDKFYLRILLLHVRGPTSFEHLRTVDDELLPDFKTACDRRNLLRNGTEYDRCMAEAVFKQYPCRLRRLFATICTIVTGDDLAQIPLLWRRYKNDMIEDYRRRGLNYGDSITRCLAIVNGILARSRGGLTLAMFGVELDQDDLRIVEEEGNAAEALEVEDLDRDNDIVGDRTTYDINRLNADQKLAFIRIIHAIKFLTGHGPLPIETYEALTDVPASVVGDRNALHSNVFYLDGPGGTGKTYLYNTLLQYVSRVMKMPTIAVAWTGIAANLLIDGKTVHKAFKLPLSLTDTTVAGWPLEHEISEYIRRAALVVWDEAPMTPCLAVDAIDRYLREVMSHPYQPFGGKCVVFGGDFRQILPVVKSAGENRAAVLDACLKSWHLWNTITQLTLKVNMRTITRNATDEGRRENIDEARVFGCPFSEWLLKLGEGTLPYADFSDIAHAPRNLVEVPAQLLVGSLQLLINFVYGNLEGTLDGDRAILCPTNSSVNQVNELILDQLQGPPVKSYFSIDTYQERDGDNFHVPQDVVNALDVPSLPPHELRLKPGAIVMLLRNLDVAEGQCNGTRMKVVSLAEHFVECEILCGTSKGRVTWIPKIRMTARDTMLPRNVERFQFPIRLAFCMTVNKSQGQTLKKVGIYLKTPCFTHGQLYVAFSRVGRPQDLRCFIECSKKQGAFRPKSKKRFTSNIIFYEVLSHNDRPVHRVRYDDDDDHDVVMTELQGTRTSATLPHADERPLNFPHEAQVFPTFDDFDEVSQSPDPYQPIQTPPPPRRERPILIRSPSPTRRPYTGYSDLSDDEDSDEEFIPNFTESQLRRRAASGGRPGTSRMPN